MSSSYSASSAVAGKRGDAGARALAGALLGVLVLHLVVNLSSPAEVIWCCYVATFVLGASTLARWPFGIGAGFLFHATIGLPGYVLDLLTGATTGTGAPLSILVHALAPLVGLFVCLRRGYPRHAWLGAWGLVASTMAASLFTDPSLNINVVHAPWEPVARWFSSIWVYRATNLAVSLALLFIVDRGLGRVFERARS